MNKHITNTQHIITLTFERLRY